VIDGKRLRISEYKQLLKAKKLADCTVAGRGGRHHQLWRDATAGKVAMAASSPGCGGQYHGDGSLNGTARAAAAEPFPFSSHHCSPCSAPSDSAYGIITIFLLFFLFSLFKNNRKKELPSSDTIIPLRQYFNLYYTCNAVLICLWIRKKVYSV